MNWINIHTETLRGEEFIGAEPLERATWLNLLGWCCAQENDGIIRDCKSWGNRKWQQLCGITKDEVDLSSDLYRFEGSNLVITFYPIEQQAAVKAKREAGKKGGRPRKSDTSKAIQNKDEKPHGYDMDNHKDKDTLNVKERKGKESKGKVIVKKPPQPPRGEMVLKLDDLPHSSQFRTSWHEWQEFRKQKRQKLTPASIKKQLTQLSKLNEHDAIASINQSITNGWTGLFDPKSNGANHRSVGTLNHGRSYPCPAGGNKSAHVEGIS